MTIPSIAKVALSAVKLPIQRLGSRPRRLRKVLFTRIQNLGDCVVFVPTLSLFRYLHPDCEIHILAGTKPGEEVFKMCPSVDKILRINWTAERSREDIQQEIAMIRSENYDAVFLSTEETGMALKMLLAGVPYRAGFSTIHHMGKTHQERFPFLLSRVIWQPEGMHEAEVNAQLARVIKQNSQSGFNLKPSDTATQNALEIVRTHSLNEHRFMLVHAGTSQAVKLWPSQSFAKCCDIVSESGIQAVFIGTKQEQDVINSVISQMTQPAISLADQTGVQELAALLLKATLFLGNDSGPMHLAAAMGTPLAAVFVASDPVVWGPYTPEMQKRVFSLQDGDVTPEAVAESLLQLAQGKIRKAQQI